MEAGSCPTAVIDPLVHLRIQILTSAVIIVAIIVVLGILLFLTPLLFKRRINLTFKHPPPDDEPRSNQTPPEAWRN